MISYGKQSIDQSDIDAVVEVLKRDWLTQGPAVETFENDLKNYFGAKHCCAVSNGTAALHLTGLALGWHPGDVIITTSITFLATANCIVYGWARGVGFNLDMHIPATTFLLCPIRISYPFPFILTGLCRVEYEVQQ